MDWLELFKAAIIGVIQGITEWLPVSSTGHIILADELIRLGVSEEFKEMFDVVIQFGSILAVVVLFFHKLNPFSPQKSSEEKKSTLRLWGKVLIAALPAALIGLPFNDLIDELFFNYQTVALTLIVYGVLFILVERRNRVRTPKIADVDGIDYRTALWIGVFQILALIPGTSRSGSTILGGILVGASRFAAAEFSFFLAIPVMLGASGLKILKFGMETGFAMTATESAVLITGMVVAFLVSLAAIRFLMGFVKRHNFKVFGYYRIVLGLLVLGYFWVMR
ncbi:MAG: undecaprenyl-diphosphate phosphatase [Ruminococcaceae bacterium]|nr:undecaprenyl-diphosphate phosphatase [Oscillospiraceae bacterium]